MSTWFRNPFAGLLLASLLCVAAASSGLAAPLPAVWRAASSAAPDALVPATNPAAAESDPGIPGAWRAQPLAAPLDVIFIDPMHGWSRDATQRTTDGGQTWTAAHAPGTSIAAFVSPTEGWAGGSRFFDDIDELCREYIDHTTDGGGTWSRQYTSPKGLRILAMSTGCTLLTGFMAGVSRVPARAEPPGQDHRWRGHLAARRHRGRDWLKMRDRTTWFRLTPRRGIRLLLPIRPDLHAVQDHGRRGYLGEPRGTCRRGPSCRA